MTCKQDKLLKIAKSQLATITALNHQALDLPCDISHLQRTSWALDYEESPDRYLLPVNKLTTDFLKEGYSIATYTIYISDDFEFVDEFFVTHV